MGSDIEIARAAKMRPIAEIAEDIGILPEELELYGRYKAKVSLDLLKRLESAPDGHLILVTAITPTPAGEGKTTTTVGLGQALSRLGDRAIITLREPSLGPCMGIKGGAAGGGYSQVVPMEDINLHFTGDIHAVTAANNLLAAMVDNHLHQGNELGIDPRQITFSRAMDMNDRALRHIVVGLGGPGQGVPREDAFQISVASEVMAILCLASGIQDLKERLGRIIVGYTYDHKPVTAADLRAHGAMAALLKEAVKPNLVQTLENTPAFVHGGPFANIAHGTNSLLATRMALKLADYVVTEAGFGADLGAEKFINITSRYGGLKPEVAVLVATVRALKMHGGVPKEELDDKNVAAVERGLANLAKHLENIRRLGLPPVVAVNRFGTDSPEEIDAILDYCRDEGVPAAVSDGFTEGGRGVEELATLVKESIRRNPGATGFLYPLEWGIKEKIGAVAREIYGADGVEYTAQAERLIRRFERLGLDKLPICMAKTQYSFSDDPTLLGRPKGFTITVRDLRISAGAGFIVALTGEVMTMPGLPKVPAAMGIDVDEEGHVTGLF